MTARVSLISIRQLNAAFLGTLCLFLIYALFPGRFDTDSGGMYAQSAGLFRSEDWASPLLEMFMSVGRRVAEGPAPLFVLQLMSWCFGLFLLTDFLIQRGHRLSALCISIGCAAPLVSFIFIDVNKDTALAALGSPLIACAVRTSLSDRRPHPLQQAGLAMLAIAFVGMRNNAIVALAPLICAWAWIVYGPPRGSWLRGADVALGVTLALVAGNKIIEYGLLKAHRSHIERALFVFDLAGIDADANASAGAEVLGPEFPRRVRACYTPKLWDAFEWGACKEVGARSAELSRTAAGRAALHGAWIKAISQHPLAYLRHRAKSFDALNRIDCDADCSGLMTGGVSLVRPWKPGTVDRISRAALFLERLANDQYVGVLGRGVLWLGLLTLSMGILAVRLWRDRTDRFALLTFAIGASGLLYDITLFLIGVAYPLRYLHWTVMTAIIAAAMTFSTLVHRRAEP